MGLFKKKEEVESKFMFYEKEKEKISKKSIIYIVVMVLVGIGVIFSFSTYLRWNRDIENRKEVVLVSNQEEKVGYTDDKGNFVEVKKLVDFYGAEQEISLRNNEATIAYCGVKKSLQGDCIEINPSNGTEKALRHPSNIICFLFILEFLLLYVLFISLPNVKRIFVYVFGGVIVLYGVILLCVQVYQVTSYFTKNNTVDGVIVKEVKDSRINNHYLPVYQYNISDKEYIYYSLNKTDKGLGEEEKLYYTNKKFDDVAEKHNPFHIISILLSVFVIIIGIIYLKVLPGKINRVINKEEEEVKA